MVKTKIIVHCIDSNDSTSKLSHTVCLHEGQALSAYTLFYSVLGDIVLHV